MIEDYLLQYGVLGLWTASLIAEKVLFQRKLINTLNDLKRAINEKFINI
jgi:hypothetical protein